MTIRFNPAVRVLPPSEVIGDRWVAENLLQKKRYNVPPSAAAALVAAIRPQPQAELVERLRGVDPASRPAAYWDGVVGSLQRHGLLVDEAQAAADADLAWMTDLRRTWADAGWREAAEYHVLAFDYPCVDYHEAAGAYFDQGRMRAYQAVEPDTFRHKDEYLGSPEITLPEPAEGMAPASAHDLWTEAAASGGDAARSATVDFESLANLAALGFGVTGMRYPVTDSAPLIRRTSPSGGGRHPSEGYVLVRDVDGLESGCYHVTMTPFSLRRVANADEAALGARLAAARGIDGPEAKAVFIVTTVFERNMYRYREPRTFRTVHMDAGHIAGTLRLAARAMGLRASVDVGGDAPAIERALGLDGMTEGYLVSVSIADGAEQEATA
ncbi:MAG TPA: SagB/ThcOx family dehydrogenase [Actinocrinis sp.]|nr:SagB/ThcOx family dehydrogenase [Actinocrinis sp.]